MADQIIIPEGVKMAPGLLLPGGCLLELDRLGLPASPNINHASEELCCCVGQRDQIFVKYLAYWRTRFADELEIDTLTATAMVLHVIEQFQINVPLWLQPINPSPNTNTNTNTKSQQAKPSLPLRNSLNPLSTDAESAMKTNIFDVCGGGTVQKSGKTSTSRKRFRRTRSPTQSSVSWRMSTSSATSLLESSRGPFASPSAAHSSSQARRLVSGSRPACTTRRRCSTEAWSRR
ncbi:hypothetical protein NUW58_g9394 [Xylaria curta]|uniref:Uncharacterized protein n=1 Tax=Xylaria curta TaxID=42375 RepID=A0ACC1MWX8_9PEZI|nr:hypothetical protein NUW58_g9394 [Xylaria curta]